MGDLIQKLPTDNVLMSQEENENFLMLFPNDQEIPQDNEIGVKTSNVQSKYDASTRKLKKEILGIFMFIAIFFILNLPHVKKLIVEYIPLCNKSWIATHIVQAIIFAFILWMVINSEYSRV